MYYWDFEYGDWVDNFNFKVYRKDQLGIYELKNKRNPTQKDFLKYLTILIKKEVDAFFLGPEGLVVYPHRKNSDMDYNSIRICFKEKYKISKDELLELLKENGLPENKFLILSTCDNKNIYCEIIRKSFVKKAYFNNGSFIFEFNDCSNKNYYALIVNQDHRSFKEWVLNVFKNKDEINLNTKTFLKLFKCMKEKIEDDLHEYKEEINNLYFCNEFLETLPDEDRLLYELTDSEFNDY